MFYRVTLFPWNPWNLSSLSWLLSDYQSSIIKAMSVEEVSPTAEKGGGVLSSSIPNSSLEIDRSQTCPVLLRCFWKLHRHQSVSEYRHVAQDIYPSQEVQIYTWPDATLREITELLKDAIEIAREPSCQLHYNLIFIDRAGFWQSKSFGNVISGRSGGEDGKTLSQVRFEAGDMLDIAITPATNNKR